MVELFPIGFAQKVEDLTNEELLAQHDWLVPAAMRLDELTREMSKRAIKATEELLADVRYTTTEDTERVAYTNEW
jgi:hypothetical protein